MARGPGAWLFHRITYRDYEYTAESGVRPTAEDDASTDRFLRRFGGRLQFAGRSVLDIGSGPGALCFRAGREGAARVVGIDLEVGPADVRLREEFPELADRVHFVTTKGDLDELGPERFDLVVSKDAMEHYADPESFVARIAPHVGPGGELAVGFSPLWKSPGGGHIDYMTPVPWAHLLFSERTIMAERRRFRPTEDASTFAEVRGGLNRMTLARFRGLMADSGFEPVYFETNVGDSAAIAAMRALARVPGLPEYFTQSVYSVWRRPAGAD